MTLSFPCFLSILLLAFQCNSPKRGLVQSDDKIPVSDNFSGSARLTKGKNQDYTCAKCTYVVPERTHEHDGEKLGLKPGDVICLDAAKEYGPLKFINIRGTEGNPITIVNCGGTVNIKIAETLSFIMKTENSEHFRITSIGTKESPYGIRLSGARQGLQLTSLSTNFEIDHLEISNVGFAGIMAKSDPHCDSSSIRGKFIMRDVSFHDNYVHDTGGEGLYVGNSFYNGGMKRDCGVLMPHDIKGVKIFDNIVINAGWEAIQLGSATEGAEVYNNKVENYGVKDKANQRGGIQLGEGTGGLCYNNIINKGNGNALIVLGYGDNIIYNNVISNAGRHAVFCDERFTKGSGFKFINNTIINPKMDGIRIYAELVEMNVIVNNIIISPGNYAEYEKSASRRPSNDAYIYPLNNSVKIDRSHNFFANDIDEVKFVDPSNSDYRLSKDSPLVDKGRDVSEFNVTFDLAKNKRPLGQGFDIGAFEYQ